MKTSRVYELSGQPSYIRFFINVVTEMNVNINNELNFSDVYRSVNYTGSLAKFT